MNLSAGLHAAVLSSSRFLVKSGKEIKMQVKPGDKVIYSKYSGTEVKVEEEDYIIVKQNDILAVIE